MRATISSPRSSRTTRTRWPPCGCSTPRATPAVGSLTPLKAAEELGEEGIETLIVWLGANNALRTVLHLKAKWSGQDYADLGKKGAYTVWHPAHFRAELAQVVAAVRQVRARHVLWATVPHVTIAPLAKGVGPRREDSRYYPYYVRPWAEDEDVTDAPGQVSEAHRRAGARRSTARSTPTTGTSWPPSKAARHDGLDWGVVDIAGVLERLAEKRYQGQVRGGAPVVVGRLPYRLPDGLEAALGFRPTTAVPAHGRQAGRGRAGSSVSTASTRRLRLRRRRPRVHAGDDDDGGEVRRPTIDFDAVVKADTLCTVPLPLGANTIDLLGELDDSFQILARFERAFRLVSPG